ncbi:hypothetical protein SAG0136_04490 [Streptococcus agalactiae LMG 14747]|uniref:Uncharacterized protein n=1 Tax=Streptococcus agalactiae LMG 14747 TaxID=1154860 RepID=V6Z0N1_STRAG|nr:hypothetical protein SAG0136_04490 [Streptococcus agalactiae LMG 14747]
MCYIGDKDLFGGAFVYQNYCNGNRNKEIDTIEYKKSLGISCFQGFLLIIDRRKWVSEILWFYGDTLDLLNVKLYVSNGS